MIKDGSNKENFIISLKTLSPLHIGSGQTIMKKDYYINIINNSVTFYNMERLLGYFAEHNLAAAYTDYILGNQDRSLNDLLGTCNLKKKDIADMELCTVSIADVMNGNFSPKTVHQFIRMPDYRPYIPGSSLKGALRTVILLSMLDGTGYTTESFKNSRGNVTASEIEEALLCTLDMKSNNAAVKSVARGLSVSDSTPTTNDDIVLAQKIDLSVKGDECDLNLFRECIKPGVTFDFAVSIDRSLLGIDSNTLMKYIEDTFDRYCNTYLRHFGNDGKDSLPDTGNNCIFLGGGTGYYSKNIAYGALGEERALQFVSQYMCRKFRKHRHEIDTNVGISPRKLKCTTCEMEGDDRAVLVQMGVCEVSIKR